MGLLNHVLGAQSLTETLEPQVWNVSPSELPRVEKQLVHALWQEAVDTAFVYYLLSLTYLRMFAAEPTYTKGLQQALQLGQEAMELQPDSEHFEKIPNFFDTIVVDALCSGEETRGFFFAS